MCEHHHLLSFLKLDANAEEAKRSNDKRQILKKIFAFSSAFLRCEWILKEALGHRLSLEFIRLKTTV